MSCFVIVAFCLHKLRNTRERRYRAGDSARAWYAIASWCSRWSCSRAVAAAFSFAAAFADSSAPSVLAASAAAAAFSFAARVAFDAARNASCKDSAPGALPCSDASFLITFCIPSSPSLRSSMPTTATALYRTRSSTSGAGGLGGLLVGATALTCSFDDASGSSPRTFASCSNRALTSSAEAPHASRPRAHILADDDARGGTASPSSRSTTASTSRALRYLSSSAPIRLET